MKFEVPKLKYEYDSLEPFIDEQTMRIHHDKHHQTYTDKLNAALEKHPELKIKNAEELLKNLNKIPEDIRIAVKNQGGGFVNHSFFWTILKKDTKLNGKIKKEIENKFGNFDKFKEEFTNASVGLFGSGWTWLVLNKGKLEIVSTANQDSPISDGKIPLLVIDLWEHAYYLKYQNRRAEYVENFFNIINWDKVNEYFINAVTK
jgi:superoxide dismutase, Fe-Mn family